MTTVKRLRILFSKSFYLFVVILLIVTGCSQSAKTPSTLSEEDKAAIKAIADKDSALVMSGNWSELVAEYTTMQLGCRLIYQQLKDVKRSGNSWTDTHLSRNLIFI